MQRVGTSAISSACPRGTKKNAGLETSMLHYINPSLPPRPPPARASAPPRARAVAARASAPSRAGAVRHRAADPARTATRARSRRACGERTHGRGERRRGGGRGVAQRVAKRAQGGCLPFVFPRFRSFWRVSARFSCSRPCWLLVFRLLDWVGCLFFVLSTGMAACFSSSRPGWLRGLFANAALPSPTCHGYHLGSRDVLAPVFVSLIINKMLEFGRQRFDVSCASGILSSHYLSGEMLVLCSSTVSFAQFATLKYKVSRTQSSSYPYKTMINHTSSKRASLGTTTGRGGREGGACIRRAETKGTIITSLRGWNAPR